MMMAALADGKARGVMGDSAAGLVAHRSGRLTTSPPPVLLVREPVADARGAELRRPDAVADRHGRVVW
jgi:hypothetical protein